LKESGPYQLAEEDIARNNINLFLAIEKAVGMRRDLTMFERIFSSIEGIVEDNRLVGRKIFQFSPASIIHQHREVRKLSLRDKGNDKVKTQTLQANDSYFFVDVFSLKMGYFRWGHSKGIIQPLEKNRKQGCGKEGKIDQEEKHTFSVKMKKIERDQSQYSSDKKKNHLALEESSDFWIEYGIEVLVICPEDYQEDENEEREADGEKRG